MISAACPPRDPFRHGSQNHFLYFHRPLYRGLRVREHGISDRQMRRWRERYQEFGYDGLFDRRQGKPSPKRVPVALVEQVLGSIAIGIAI